MEGELLDWELVHGSDTESTDSITSNNKSGSSSAIDDGMILSDHFSAGNLIKLPGVTTDQSQYGVTESGDSFRLDYGSDRRQNPGEVLADLEFDQPGDSYLRNELGFYDTKTGISGDGKVKLSDFEPANEKEHVESEAVAELTDGRQLESQSGVEEPIEDSGNSRGNELVSVDSATVNGEEDDIVSDSGVVSTDSVVGSGRYTEEVVGDVNSADESKSREIVWWKMPLVLLKYCAFRIGPVWSVSMAAAVMGLALLGRRLYNMKKNAQRFNLKVTIDDKKAARVMSQAARLNEVFTEVRRVPVIRPALPSPGVWPVLSLR